MYTFCKWLWHLTLSLPGDVLKPVRPPPRPSPFPQGLTDITSKFTLPLWGSPKPIVVISRIPLQNRCTVADILTQGIRDSQFSDGLST